LKSEVNVRVDQAGNQELSTPVDNACSVRHPNAGCRRYRHDRVPSGENRAICQKPARLDVDDGDVRDRELRPRDARLPAE
jgi:hypothetical protein